MIPSLQIPHQRRVPPAASRPRVRRAGPARTRRLLALALLSTPLVMAACTAGPDPLDAAAAESFIIPEVPVADPSTGPSPEPDDAADTGNDAEDADLDNSVPLHAPQTVELACDAVAGLAALGAASNHEQRREREVAELLETLSGWQALLEIAYPDAASAGEVVEARREALADVIELLTSLDPDVRSFVDLELTTFGRLYDRASALMAVEDEAGEWLDLVGEPVVDAPDPLVEAGCDVDEVMAVVGRDAADLIQLEWPLDAVANDPDTVPFHDALGIGEASMDVDSTDPRARVCPVPAWSSTTELVSLDVDPWGVAATCEDAQGVIVTMSANPTFVLQQLGDDAQLVASVMMAGDEQAVAVRHSDRPVWLVARGPEDIEVPLDTLVAAVQGGS